jgi:hypothetical protein
MHAASQKPIRPDVADGSKPGKAQSEHMISAVLPKADIPGGHGTPSYWSAEAMAICDPRFATGLEAPREAFSFPAQLHQRAEVDLGVARKSGCGLQV